MNVNTFKPSGQLKSIVKSITVIETKSALETIVLPHFGLVLAIQLWGNVSMRTNNQIISIAPLTISGQRNTFRTFLYSPNTTIILVSFTETGGYSIFGGMVYKLYERAEPLDCLFSSTNTNELLEKLSLPSPNEVRIKIIENFLLRNLSNPKPDMLVLEAIKKIRNNKEGYRISQLSSEFNLSLDAFEKRFRKVVGSTPKQFSTIVKMKEVINHKSNVNSFAELAYSFDFFDQTHFVKQFKNFTGQTPKQFFRQPYIW